MVHTRRGFIRVLPALGAAPETPPLRLGMAGLVHGHAAGFLNRYKNRTDIQLGDGWRIGVKWRITPLLGLRGDLRGYETGKPDWGGAGAGLE